LLLVVLKTNIHHILPIRTSCGITQLYYLLFMQHPYPMGSEETLCVITILLKIPQVKLCFTG